MNFDLTGIRYRDYIVDSAEGSLNSSDDILGLDRLNLRRKQNELNVRGRYLLPAEVSKFASQPAEVDIALNAPEAGDFWVADSPSRVSGPLQSQAQIEWKQEVASGQLWLAGSNLRMRDLVFRQISAQCSISNSDVYVNDFSASSEQHRLRQRNWDIQLATASSLQRQGVRERIELGGVRAAFARVREPEPTGRLVQIGLGGQRPGMTASRLAKSTAAAVAPWKHRQPQARSGKSALRKFARAPGEHRRVVLARRS